MLAGACLSVSDKSQCSIKMAKRIKLVLGMEASFNPL